MVGWRRKFLRCRRSKTGSALILRLFLRVKIFHREHRKFTFLLFRSNYNCLLSHFNDVALAVTKLQKHRRIFSIALWTARAKLTHPQYSNTEKSSSRDNFEQAGSVQCIYIVFFNLIKLNMHLKKITHLKKFSSKRNWE